MTLTPEPSPAQATTPLVPSTTPFDFNKAAIFTALEAAGITQITVTFDGYGDSGQIEGISASIGEAPTQMPDCMVETLGIAWPQTEPAFSSLSLATAVENLAYDVLAQTHCGWWSRDKALHPVARASFLIPLAEPDVRVSLHPALYVRLTPQVDLITG
ncbi:DUF6878 family protein [Acidocella sp.]|uniref:DUF6878 family protein n=1 Tax=Acidocella sp. TaxID=50710 RepID=UPI002618B038|nr:DUF6878 family protein [Acidocella sp.]